MTQLVIRRIKQALLSGALKPGDRLPSEPELASKWGVGRTSVREALKMLVALGVLEVRRGAGTYVVESMSSNALDPLVFSLLLQPATQAELMEFRQTLELDLVRFAVERATDEDLDRMQHSIDQLEQLALRDPLDPALLVQADLDFHAAVHAATHNRFLAKIGDSVMQFFSGPILTAMTTVRGPWNAVRVHKQYLDAIKNRDLEAGRQAVQEAVQIWNTYLR